MNTSTPTLDQVRSLPTTLDQPVGDDAIDENGHMNVAVYFHDGAWGPWERMVELGAGERYIAERGLSFFTVEHRLRYLSELRLGERYTVHAGFVGRTSKALHAVSFVVDEAHDRLACVLEAIYVHVSMESRRAVAIPDDLAATLDAEIAEHSWLGEIDTGLSLHP